MHCEYIYTVYAYILYIVYIMVNGREKDRETREVNIKFFKYFLKALRFICTQEGREFIVRRKRNSEHLTHSGGLWLSVCLV